MNSHVPGQAIQQAASDREVEADTRQIRECVAGPEIKQDLRMLRMKRGQQRHEAVTDEGGWGSDPHPPGRSLRSKIAQRAFSQGKFAKNRPGRPDQPLSSLRGRLGIRRTTKQADALGNLQT